MKNNDYRMKIKSIMIIVLSITIFLCYDDALAESNRMYTCWYSGKSATISYLGYTQISRPVESSISFLGDMSDYHYYVSVDNSGHSIDIIKYKINKTDELYDLVAAETINGENYYFCPSGYYHVVLNHNLEIHPFKNEYYTEVSIKFSKNPSADNLYQKYSGMHCWKRESETKFSMVDCNSSDHVYSYNVAADKNETDSPSKLEKCTPGGYDFVKAKVDSLEKSMQSKYVELENYIKSVSEESIDGLEQYIADKSNEINSAVSGLIDEIDKELVDGNYCIYNDELLTKIKNDFFEKINSIIKDKKENLTKELESKVEELNLSQDIVTNFEDISKIFQENFESKLSSWHGFTLDVPTGNLKRCINIVSNDLIIVLKLVFNIIRIAVPILLIVFVTIDFASGVLSNDKDAVSKIISKSIKRAIAAIVIFFIPTLVGLLINTAGQSTYSDSSGDFIFDDSSCLDAINK